MVENVFKRLREGDTWEQLHYVWPEELAEGYVLWKGSKDTSFTKAIWYTIVKVALPD